MWLLLDDILVGVDGLTRHHDDFVFGRVPNGHWVGFLSGFVSVGSIQSQDFGACRCKNVVFHGDEEVAASSVYLRTLPLECRHLLDSYAQGILAFEEAGQFAVVFDAVYHRPVRLVMHQELLDHVDAVAQGAVVDPLHVVAFGTVVTVEFAFESWFGERAGDAREVGAVAYLHAGTILPGGDVDLGAVPGGFGKAPFSAGGPAAVVLVHCLDVLAHDWYWFEVGVEGLVGGDVDRYREVDEGDAAEDDDQLAEADAAADFAVLLGDDSLFALVATAHGEGTWGAGGATFPRLLPPVRRCPLHFPAHAPLTVS